MHRVVTVMGHDVAMFELAVPCEVFGIDRPEIPTWRYEHVVCSAEQFGHASQGGLRLQAGVGLDAVETADTVVVPAWSMSGNVAPPTASPPDVLDALRAAHDRGARMVSLCTGAFLLAQAGILDGRRATTHWHHTDDLAAWFPNVDVDPGVLYVSDGNVHTSAGTAAGIDLCLHLVRLDLGAEAANTVARRMVVPPHRDGGQAQFVRAPVPSCPDGDPLRSVLTWMLDHLERPLTVEDLARRAALSPRTFARRFVEVTGTTPLQWLLAQRALRARSLLETTDLPVEQIAHRCGFSSAAGLRAHFQRVVGASPAAYRRTFRGDIAS